MALFSRKKADQPNANAVVEKAPAFKTAHFTAGVILRPHLSEKSVVMGEGRVYTFFVEKSATKSSIASAIKAIYQVTPVKVNIVNKLPRAVQSRTRGRMVTEPGFKKAYVYLKPGDTINLI